ncbi:MAG: glycosyltransferase family 2 protein [Oscillospiraceae bacterium]|nr:glycosyltransferase family 2 protein [Oscillospiraceae bacterium]
MLLTIGMIVKNEEKMLGRCLEALQPILKNISSELIIVDTGSTDGTVEIAKKYTDKVLFYEWTNDFSAARNVGLMQAQGEWFMSVDADEIFISCDDIISFFKSGEYKEYNSASFSVRNYNNPERTGRYVDFFVPRLTKILPETKFINPVHEKLNTHRPPVRLIKDIADHYGYVQTVSAEKSKRNYEILKNRLESGEESASLYRELFEALNSDKETEALAYEYLEKGIALCKENNDDYVLALYHCMISSYVARRRYDDAVRVHEEYFSLSKEIKNEIRSTDLEIIAFAAIALYSSERYDEAYEMANSYFSLYDTIKRQNINTRDILYSYRYMSDENALAEMNLYYAVCCIKTRHYKEAENSFRNYPVSVYSGNSEYFYNRIAQEKSLLNEYDSKKLVSVLSEGDGKLQKELFRAFRSLVFEMPENERNAVINKLSSVNLKSASQRKLVSIYKEHFSGRGAGEARLMTYAEKHGMDYPDLLYIMVDEGIAPVPYLSKCEDVERLMETGFRTIRGFAERASKIDFSDVARGDIYTAARACLCTINGLLKVNTSASFLYSTAGNLGIMYLNAFGENSIPAEIMAAVTMAEINILRNNRDYKNCIDALRRLIRLDRKYAAIAMDYQNIIKSEMALYMK